MEDDVSKKYGITYPLSGTNKIERKITDKDFQIIRGNTGKLMVNDSQYFENIPHAVWEYRIGGFQPAQKWLKDRIGRVLESSEIRYYIKMLSVLAETIVIQKNIDE